MKYTLCIYILSSFLPDSPKIPVSHEKHVTDVSRVTEIEKRNSREIRESKIHVPVTVYMYMYLYLYMYMYLYLYLCSRKTLREEREIFKKRERARFSPFWVEFWVRVRKRN